MKTKKSVAATPFVTFNAQRKKEVIDSYVQYRLNRMIWLLYNLKERCLGDETRQQTPNSLTLMNWSIHWRDRPPLVSKLTDISHLINCLKMIQKNTQLEVGQMCCRSTDWFSGPNAKISFREQLSVCHTLIRSGTTISRSISISVQIAVWCREIMLNLTNYSNDVCSICQKCQEFG